MPRGSRLHICKMFGSSGTPPSFEYPQPQLTFVLLAPSSCYGGVAGGAVYATRGSQVHLESTSIRRAGAYLEGGAVASDGGRFTLANVGIEACLSTNRSCLFIDGVGSGLVMRASTVQEVVAPTAVWLGANFKLDALEATHISIVRTCAAPGMLHIFRDVNGSSSFDDISQSKYPLRDVRLDDRCSGTHRPMLSSDFGAAPIIPDCDRSSWSNEEEDPMTGCHDLADCSPGDSPAEYINATLGGSQPAALPCAMDLEAQLMAVLFGGEPLNEACNLSDGTSPPVASQHESFTVQLGISCSCSPPSYSRRSAPFVELAPYFSSLRSPTVSDAQSIQYGCVTPIASEVPLHTSTLVEVSIVKTPSRATPDSGGGAWGLTVPVMLRISGTDLDEHPLGLTYWWNVRGVVSTSAAELLSLQGASNVTAFDNESTWIRAPEGKQCIALRSPRTKGKQCPVVKDSEETLLIQFNLNLSAAGLGETIEPYAAGVRPV